MKDGYIWGRGALDMKGEGIAQLMAMIALKRSGVPLNRDIVFIGNADEELGSTGAIMFVEQARRPAEGRRVPDHRGRRQLVDEREARSTTASACRREADVLAEA